MDPQGTWQPVVEAYAAEDWVLASANQHPTPPS
jgi:hypothetical protein